MTALLELLIALLEYLDLGGLVGHQDFLAGHRPTPRYATGSATRGNQLKFVNYLQELMLIKFSFVQSFEILTSLIIVLYLAMQMRQLQIKISIIRQS